MGRPENLGEYLQSARGLDASPLDALGALLAQAISLAPADEQRLSKQIADARRRCKLNGDPRGELLFRAYRLLLGGTGVLGVMRQRIECRLGGPLSDEERRQIVQALAACDYPRAQWLAGLTALYQGAELECGRQDLSGQIRAHRDARPADVTAAEQLLAETRYCLALVKAERFGDALEQAVRWRDAAVHQGLPSSEQNATNSIGSILLSVGDVDAALPQFRRLLDEMPLGSVSNWMGLACNVMLCHVLRKEGEAALMVARWIQERSGGQDFGQHPVLPALIALAHTQCGEDEQARALILREPVWKEGLGTLLAGNRVWLLARLHLHLRQYEQAREVCVEGLDQFERHGWTLSPLNGTQLFAALADACEALGDLPGALKALRQSQQCCFNWVVDSVAMRLRGLIVESAQGDLAMLDRRIEVVREAGRAAQDALPEDLSARRLAQVSHEIRNPLSGVIAITELLKQTSLSRRQSRYVDMAGSAATNLVRLCDDLLDLAKLEAGRFRIRPAPLQLPAMLQSVVDHYQLLLADRPVRLSLTLHPALPSCIIADELRLRQILSNLLGNAIKFTSYGHIDIEARWLTEACQDCSQGRLYVSVSDTGIGFPLEVKDQLFEEFAQAGPHIGTSFGGAGLGLALCRSLLKEMGGTIDASSVPGVGSRFWFTLPTQGCQACSAHSFDEACHAPG
ncbi:HAMP domain-containing histidine kinase [Pelomonas sp. CA6]|uniref:sensor histidine kinase n=1 Tax=Pelomonas sp. CA6 TaxID=2907999 RepID=UPI001F4BE3CB|nr:HAMP domain-containing sensor histidine kinase [Pelomonas sp. CA6]MCH7344396.1 HAMP domain-containing histidine kinase [Pelomonas sp. CA6]